MAKFVSRVNIDFSLGMKRTLTIIVVLSGIG